LSAPARSLPEGFEALEPFVEAWAIRGAAARAGRRVESSAPERVAFFDVAKDLVADALTHLDRKPLGDLDAEEQRLMDLMLSFAHVALAVEIQLDDESRHAELSRHLAITRASSDAEI